MPSPQWPTHLSVGGGKPDQSLDKKKDWTSSSPLLSILHHPIHYSSPRIRLESQHGLSTVMKLWLSHGLFHHQTSNAEKVARLPEGTQMIIDKALVYPFLFVSGILCAYSDTTKQIVKHRRYIWHQHVRMFMRISFFIECTNHSRALPSLL